MGVEQALQLLILLMLCNNEKVKLKGQFLAEASTAKLKAMAFRFDCNEVDSPDIYVDGADEINHQMQMIKGGGAALTREKSFERWQNLCVYCR